MNDLLSLLETVRAAYGDRDLSDEAAREIRRLRQENAELRAQLRQTKKGDQ